MAGEAGGADNNQLDSELLCQRGGVDEALLTARYGGLPFTKKEFNDGEHHADR
jgi:hypothetical protein